jgi:hypothetical protein
MKKSLIIFFSLITSIGWCQSKITPTEEFTISGKIKKELKITVSDLSKYKEVVVGNLIVSNHLGEIKDTAKGLKGVLLKDILTQVEFLAEKPKVLSEFCLVCVASDGYKVVFSWNELFNTETGNHVYLITEKNGTKAGELGERIVLVSTTDFKTGRRYLKGLSKILVERIQ